MSELVDELLHIDSELRAFIEKSRGPKIEEPLERLRYNAEEVGKAWSGSCLGYHANIYYADLKPPPPGAHFSVEWGLMPNQVAPGTRGDWREQDPDGVYKSIREKAGNPDLGLAQALKKEGCTLFDEKRHEILSILETALLKRQDRFIERLKDEAEKQKVSTSADFVEMYSGGRVVTRDRLALSQGIRLPAHLSVLAEVFSLQNPANKCESIAAIANKAASHLTRVERSRKRSEMIGTNVFIGHGHSLIWKDLKDFVQDRLNLPWDEFNRIPVAGITNIARLSEMLDAAAIAFLVMTGEDEQTDGKMNARMNVVHEAGLFQGRLGFTRAIVLLEEGCEEFSNIHGLGQIRFPKGNIKAVFEEVRQVLEREGVIES